MKLFLFELATLFLYFGLSEGMAPIREKTMSSLKDLSTLDLSPPFSLILTDMVQTGVLIKTHYLKFRIVRPLSPPRTLNLRASQSFWETAQSDLGLSFLHQKNLKKEDPLPLPPGLPFLGDPTYGYFVNQRWRFHAPYLSMPKKLGWGDFRPSLEFYQNIHRHQRMKIRGAVTSKTHFRRFQGTQKQEWREYVKKMMFIPPWKAASP